MTPIRRTLARPFSVALIAALAIAVLPGGTARPVAAVSDPSDPVFINEIHYDNTGTDAGEAIEIAGPAGTDLTGWAIVLYNGSGGATYDTDALSGTIGDQGAGYGTAVITYPANGVQNGAPDGIALVQGTTVRQFLSYEGVFAATNGPASGMTSTDIGVFQGGSGAIGLSLQLQGTGTTYGDFSWTDESASSFALINAAQIFGDEDAAPNVADTTPTDGADDVDVHADVVVTFSEPVAVTGAWFSISCTISGEHSATVAEDGTSLTLDPDTDFASAETCTVTIVAAQVSDDDADDPPDTMAEDHIFSFETSDPAVSIDVTISQVYGGGGNAGATLRNDFIELFNLGTADVSVAGWSVQYAGATGTGAWQVTPLSGEIPTSKHYLVQEAPGANTALPFPVPDAMGTIAMSSTAGKVALVKTTTALSGACPTSTDIIDLVGYGAANCFEGSGPTPPLSNTTAALRKDDGATDTDVNAADFVVGVPNPRPSREPAPTVSSTFPADAALGVAKWSTLTVNFSEPVNVTGTWFTIVCATSGTHTAAASGANTTFLLDPTTDLTGGESCTLTVVAANVTDQDADDPPDTMAADHVVTFTVASDVACGAPATFIHDVQGSGLASPITNQVVEVEGVVVGSFPGSTGFQGLHVQEEDADADVDASTSEGIFIFEPNGGATYAVGDQVRIRGRVTEFTTSGVTLTELANLNNLEVCGAGAAITPSDVALPFDSTTEAEHYEGMLVVIDQDLTVTETFSLGRFGEVVVSSGGRLPIPTAIVEPGSPEYTALVNLNLRSRLVLDDGDNRQNLDPTLYPIGGLSASDTLRIGDTLEGGSGTFVLEQRFGVYRIQPTADLPALTVGNPRPAAPDAVGGSLRVASMNVLNFFTTLDSNPGSGNGPNICGPSLLECRGASTAFEFDRQRAKVLAALEGLDADVVGLMEIENNDSASVESIVDGLNAELGAGAYAFIDTGTIGTDAIKVAFIYQPARAIPIGAYAILDSDVDPRFIDTLNRPAIAQTFESTATGGRATIIVNHLKSKGSACAGDPDLGDGQGNCNLTRVAAAEALVDWIASDPTDSGDADAIVIGDLNSYTREDPIDVFVDADYDNLIETYVGPDAYSYVFSGESGYLDHALARAGLAAQATGATEWHINADEPIVLDYNTDFKSAGHIETLYADDAYRSSDHDPVLIGLDLLAYDFGGFQSPANPGGVTQVKAGSALPLKFSLDGNQGLAVLAGAPSLQRHACPTGAPIGPAIPAVASEPFAYDAATDTYRFTWKTQKAWAGWCGTLTVALADGESYGLEVRFKP